MKKIVEVWVLGLCEMLLSSLRSLNSTGREAPKLFFKDQ